MFSSFTAYLPPPARRRSPVELSFPLVAYVLGVVALAIGLGVIESRSVSLSPVLLVLLVTAFLLRLYATPIGSGGNWSSANYVSLATTYIFGMVGAGACAIIEGSASFRGPSGWIRSLFNSAQLFVGLACGYLVYLRLAGGGLAMAALGALLGGGTDWLVSASLVSVVVVLNRQGLSIASYLARFPLDLALGWSAFGFVLLYPYGLVGISVVITPVVLFQVAMVIMYQHQQQEAAERQRHEKEREELLVRTLRDPLTNLPNRILLLDRINHSVSRRPQSGGSEWLGLLYVDIDEFKAINDNAGHAAGDSVLQTVADRLRQVCREHDTVARIGGDEFVVLLDALADPSIANAVAGRLLQALREPVHTATWHGEISASLGGVLFPVGGSLSSEEMLAQADALMYRAKRSGKNRAVVAELGQAV